MAPIYKASLAFLAASASLVAASAHPGTGTLTQPGQHFGKHLKLVKREELKERDNFAPYGYDRCGAPRKSPYVRKPGASPSASAKWKPCPDQTPEEAAKANAAVPTDKEEHEEGSTARKTGSSSHADTDVPAEGEEEEHNDPTPTDTWDRAMFTPQAEQKKVVAPAAANNGNKDNEAEVHTEEPESTYVETSWVDVTSTETWQPEATSTPVAAAPSSSAPAQEESQEGVFNPGNNGNVHIVDGHGSGDWSEPSSSSSSAAPAYTPPAPSGGGGANKLGLAWDWQNPRGKLSQWTGAGAIYTWSAYPPSDPLPAGMEWYPQYWGPGKQGDFESQVASGAIHPGMTILGYNEPDQPGQANLGVWDAIGSFKRQITPYASQGYKIASPACTSDEKGIAWITEFMNNCQDCGISILQTHFYGTNADDFIAYIQRLRGLFGLPIIISEYASETFGNGPDLSLEETQAYVSKTQDWLKSQGDVLAYFYFGPITPQAANGVNHNSLMISGAGDINDLGRQYLYNGI